MKNLSSFDKALLEDEYRGLKGEIFWRKVM